MVLHAKLGRCPCTTVVLGVVESNFGMGWRDPGGEEEEVQQQIIRVGSTLFAGSKVVVRVLCGK